MSNFLQISKIYISAVILAKHLLLGRKSRVNSKFKVSCTNPVDTFAIDLLPWAPAFASAFFISLDFLYHWQALAPPDG